MSTHYSLFMRVNALQDGLMVSASLFASLFCSGLVLGYALRACNVRRRLVNVFPSIARSSAKPAPTSTFGHARRAF